MCTPGLGMPRAFVRVCLCLVARPPLPTVHAHADLPPPVWLSLGCASASHVAGPSRGRGERQRQQRGLGDAAPRVVAAYVHAAERLAERGLVAAEALARQCAVHVRRAHALEDAATAQQIHVVALAGIRIRPEGVALGVAGVCGGAADGAGEGRRGEERGGEGAAPRARTRTNGAHEAARGGGSGGSHL